VKHEACAKVADRVFDLCMAGPKADSAECVEASDDAYARCLNPSLPAPAGAKEDPYLSANEYRIPYADGTKIHITHDFYDHGTSFGKMDIVGRGGGPYRVVAARAGTIRYIQDTRSKQQIPKPWWHNEPCTNNYVWIQHDTDKDGIVEWTKYSHLQQYTTSGKAKLRVGDRVAEGQYLGDEGHVGCAWPAHLHWEVVVPPPPSDPSKNGGLPGVEPLAGGLEGQSDATQRNPRISNLSGATFKDGETYRVNPPLACKKDGDCGSDEWCNEGVDLTKNVCQPKKADNEVCAAIGGGHQCTSGQCRFSRCYTPGSVGFNGTCYNDAACASGKCSDPDGIKGRCVCQKDVDCSGTDYCDHGLDLNLNQCRPLLNNGQKCGSAATFGNDRKCKSGKCSGFPNYKCKA
jgi:murein DD-endopeptidase MepM/ murein hydrolase activator NlpD